MKRDTAHRRRVEAMAGMKLRDVLLRDLNEGFTEKDIATYYEVSRSTIHYWMLTEGIKRRWE